MINRTSNNSNLSKINNRLKSQTIKVSIFPINLQFSDLRITNQSLRTLYLDNLNNNKVKESVFAYIKLCNLIDQYQKNQSSQLEDEIKRIVWKKLFEIIPENNNMAIYLKNQIYLMNKNGSFIKRQLQRKCRITEKGFQQAEDEKNFKQIFIKSFKTEIQKFSTKPKNDINWISDNKKHQWRVILVDKNNNFKAIYTEKYEEAQAIRDYCFYLFKKPIIPLVKMIKKYKLTVIQKFGNNLKKYIDKKNKQILRSKYENKQQDESMIKSEKNIIKVNHTNSNKNIANIVELNIQNQPRKTFFGQQNINDFQNEKKKIALRNLKFSDEKIVKNLLNKWAAKQQNKIEQLQLNRNNKSINNNKVNKDISLVERFSLNFLNIQLLYTNEIFTKPFLQIQIVKNESNILFQEFFNTILLKQSPSITYELVAQHDQKQIIEFDQNINNLDIFIKITDKISEKIIIEEYIRFRLKERNNQILRILNKDQKIRIHIEYTNLLDTKIKKQSINNQINQEGLIIYCKDYPKQIDDTIKQFWADQVVHGSYYSPDIQIGILQILKKVEINPKYWWFGVSQDEYQILQLLQSCSRIIKFTLIQSTLYIVRSLVKIYNDKQKIIQIVFKKILSIITNYMKPYFYREELNKIQKIHRLIGVDVNCEYSSKITLEINIINRILSLQDPKLTNKLIKKNFNLSLLLYQYLYELYSKNFNLQILVQVWNYLFSDQQGFQQKLLLVAVCLVLKNSKSIMLCNKFSQIITVFEDKRSIKNSNDIINLVQLLNKKYFQQASGILQSMTNKLFNESPFDQMVASFYKAENERIEQITKRKLFEKKDVLQKLTQERNDIIFPSYQNRKYTLHIYFHHVSEKDGNIYIKSVEQQYQCLDIVKVPYYIIQNITQQVMISFNKQGKTWKNTVIMIQGIHHTKLKLYSNDEQIEIQYTIGLLTQAQQQMIKKQKSVEHLIGSYIKLQNLVNECNRNLSQCSFFRSQICKNYQTNQIIKLLFTAGGNKFNEIEFYLSWIQNLKVNLQTKIFKLREYSELICKQLFHCESTQIFKILLKEYLSRINFPISDCQFQIYYNLTLNEFDFPKIIKIKYIHQADNTVIKITKDLYKQINHKFVTGLYPDLIFTHKAFLGEIYKIISLTYKDIEGSILILYSSYGKLQQKSIPICWNKQKKQLQINKKHQQYSPLVNEIDQSEPEVLSVESYPSFSRITKILQSEEKSVNKYLKLQEATQNTRRQISKMQQNKQFLNILSYITPKYQTILQLRYKQYPKQVKIPFLDYFCQLNDMILYPALPILYLDNSVTSAKKICIHPGELQMSDNLIGENLIVDKSIGIYENIQKYNSNNKVIYFWSVKKQEIIKKQYQIFVNYGFGIFRWQKFKVKGYCRGQKNRNAIYYIAEIRNKYELVAKEDIKLMEDDVFIQIKNDDETYNLKQMLNKIQGHSIEQKENQIIQTKKFPNFLKRFI